MSSLTEDDLFTLLRQVRAGRMRVDDAVDQILNVGVLLPPLLPGLKGRYPNARQIFITHEGLWEDMKRWAAEHRFSLQRIPDGADDDGVAFFREEKPDTECAQCGHTPTYAFMPKDV